MGRMKQNFPLQKVSAALASKKLPLVEHSELNVRPAEAAAAGASAACLI